MQVSFGIHETEEDAARQYDRALIVEKGRSAKTNFPIVLYEEEVAYFEASIAARYSLVLPKAGSTRSLPRSGFLLQTLEMPATIATQKAL